MNTMQNNQKRIKTHRIYLNFLDFYAKDCIFKVFQLFSCKCLTIYIYIYIYIIDVRILSKNGIFVHFYFTFGGRKS